MSYRFAAPTAFVPGAYCFGGTGLGVLGSTVPSTGTHGPAYTYNDLALPADAAKEIRGLITSHDFPAGTFFAYEDTSFTVIGAPDATYHANYRLDVDGAAIGTATFAVTIGTAGPTCFIGITTDASVFAGSAAVAQPASASFSLVTAPAAFSGSATGLSFPEALPRNTLAAKERVFTLTATAR